VETGIQVFNTNIKTIRNFSGMQIGRLITRGRGKKKKIAVLEVTSWLREKKKSLVMIGDVLPVQIAS